MNRRDFLKTALLTATVPFMPAWLVLASSETASDTPFVPKFLESRPKIEGKFGSSYFMVNVGRTAHQFRTVYKGFSIFLGEVNVMCSTFEVDLAGGWVGMYWGKYHGFNSKSGHPQIMADDGRSLRKVWCYGPLMLRPGLSPRPTKKPLIPITEERLASGMTIRSYVNPVTGKKEIL